MPDYHSGASHLAPLAIAVPILTACLLVAVGRLLPRPAIDAIAAGGALGVVGLDAALFAHTSAGRVTTWAGGWTPVHGRSVGIVLVVDRIGAGAALLAAMLVLAALVFSWRYFDSVQAHFHALLLLFLAGLTGYALTGDLFDMFVFFELLGAASYALAGFKVEEPRSLQGALNFAITNSFGGFLTLVGIALIYAHTGELGMAQIGARLDATGLDALVVVAFVLIVSGWLAKAATVPFHFWHADAHAVAPSPVCVVFSGAMVELGIYGAYRVYWTSFSGVIGVETVRRAFLVLGVLTAVVGALMCLGQHNLKRLLAFSTIAHVGLFICAAAMLDGPGTAGAALYVLGHAGTTGALFLVAGVLLNRYGSIVEDRLHGEGRTARWTGAMFVVGALGTAALPPFGTGLGKAIGEDALLHAGYGFGPALFVAVSAITGGAMLRFGARVFLGLGDPPRDDGHEASEDEETEETEGRVAGLPPTMGLTIVALLCGSLITGVYPPIVHALGQGATQFVDHQAYLRQALFGLSTRPAELPTGIDWTTLGVALDLVSVVLALAVAAVGIYAARIATAAGRALRPFSVAFAGLRQLHSGHVGDYVAWLFVGVSVLAALIGIPLRA